MTDHDHHGEYAEPDHRHYDLERDDAHTEKAIKGLRDEIRNLSSALDRALSRIAQLEKSTPEARQAAQETDMAAADLAESGDDRGSPIGAPWHGATCKCEYCYDESNDYETPEYDPGPECDDQGGMSEYHITLPGESSS
jgi:hypothetical protein